MTSLPHFVSLDDAEATKDELEALRGVMRSDQPFADETPVLEDYEPPSEADARWWLMETEPPGEWLDVDLEPLPEATVSGSWDLPNGQFGHAREEP